MWRWADVKMSRCERRCERRYDEESEQMREDVREDVREDMKMSRCEDEQMWEKMWRWADVKMSRCEDEKVWRWEGEIQTPTIGRTLRSDALGKNVPNHQPYIYIHIDSVWAMLWIFRQPELLSHVETIPFWTMVDVEIKHRKAYWLGP